MYKEKVFNIGYGDDYITHKEVDKHGRIYKEWAGNFTVTI